MTRAKRYEGEKLRSEQWHAALSWTAYKRADQARMELGPMLHKTGFLLRAREIYDAINCEYVIEFSVYRGTDDRGTQVWSGDAVFEHVEPWSVAPSNHLKTKLLLITGGTVNA